MSLPPRSGRGRPSSGRPAVLRFATRGRSSGEAKSIRVFAVLLIAGGILLGAAMAASKHADMRSKLLWPPVGGLAIGVPMWMLAARMQRAAGTTTLDLRRRIARVPGHPPFALDDAVALAVSTRRYAASVPIGDAAQQTTIDEDRVTFALLTRDVDPKVAGVLEEARGRWRDDPSRVLRLRPDPEFARLESDPDGVLVLADQVWGPDANRLRERLVARLALPVLEITADGHASLRPPPRGETEVPS